MRDNRLAQLKELHETFEAVATSIIECDDTLRGFIFDAHIELDAQTDTKRDVSVTYITQNMPQHGSTLQYPLSNGTYYLHHKVNGENLHAAILYQDGMWIVQRGTYVARNEGRIESDEVKSKRARFIDTNGFTTHDVAFTSPSAAGAFVMGRQLQGTKEITKADGTPISKWKLTDVEVQALMN